MAECHRSGVLDTCTYIDLDLLDPKALPTVPEITAVTMAELQQGVAMAKDPQRYHAMAEAGIRRTETYYRQADLYAFYRGLYQDLARPGYQPLAGQARRAA